MWSKRSVLYVLLSFCAGSIFVMFFINIFEKTVNKDYSTQKDQSVIKAQASIKSNCYLYFSDNTNTFLTAEQRSILYDEDPAKFSKNIITSLILGSKHGLTRTIPALTKLKALYLTDKGISVLDFSSDLKEKHPKGCLSELITIYSIVNSLVLNIPEIIYVKILIEGRESMTLAGHVDLRLPFTANMLFVR